MNIVTVKTAKETIRKSNLPKKVIKYFLQLSESEWNDILLFVNETYVLWDITKSHPSNRFTNINELSLKYLQAIMLHLEDEKGIMFSVVVKLFPKELSECAEKNYKLIKNE
jgi:hypothetical protein